jgi:hypothetical protein
MEEIRKLQGTGVSSLLYFGLTLPPGHEMLGFEDENGVFYSVEQLKAIEWQENKMESCQKAVNSLEQAIAGIGQIAKNPDRVIKRMYRLGDMTIAIGSDDTVWYLSEGDRIVGPSHWKKMRDMACPGLPQGDF